jgi:hypothetical protein
VTQISSKQQALHHMIIHIKKAPTCAFFPVDWLVSLGSRVHPLASRVPFRRLGRPIQEPQLLIVGRRRASTCALSRAGAPHDSHCSVPLTTRKASQPTHDLIATAPGVKRQWPEEPLTVERLARQIAAQGTDVNSVLGGPEPFGGTWRSSVSIGRPRTG